MTELPISFLNMMQELLGDAYQDYLDSFGDDRMSGLRANTMKLTAKELKERLPYPLRRVPWIENGFYYEEETRLSKDPYYYAGLYYLQEPSAMTPASMLPVEPGDTVLDLCAAPGGKSTELGAKLDGTGMLFSNDISNSRAKALLKNIELFGIANSCVTSESPQKLAEALPEFFDKILVDAPCSGEGMFRKDGAMVKSWLERGPAYYREIQTEIAGYAVEMLKPDGYLLYSTCTFSRMEDEEVVEHLLKSFPEMELIPLPLFEGAAGGIGLPGCMRLYPHRIQGEGHFLALLHKKSRGERVSLQTAPAHISLNRESGLSEFLKLIKRDFSPERFMIKNNCVYYLPKGFPAKANLRYLRTGLLVGELRNGRLEPSQALAMALKREEFFQSVSFSREDERVIRYLKGETVGLLEEEHPVKGWCLVCVDGFPLGFAKGTGMSLKNKYYPGWRWQ